jgi:hypothetical protein
MKHLLLGIAVVAVVGIAFFIRGENDNEIRLMNEKIKKLQDHFQSLDHART